MQTRIPVAFALLKIVLHLPVLHRYGYHHDELYFIACGNHPALGYVDHAPLVPWIARLATTLFGESLVGLRIFPLLAGAVSVLLVGHLARRLGGGRFAQALACLAIIVAPVYLRTANMLCIPAFEPLYWLVAAHLVVSIARGGSPRLWLGVGAVAGVGVMNKHSMLFFGFGLAVAMIVTPLRRHLRSPWPYLGGAVALLIFLPNLLWQLENDWATLEFLRNLNAGTMSGISALQFVAGQVLYLNPVNALVWISGLLYLLRNPAAKPYRFLAWIFVAVFLLLVATKSKIYYLAPAYPPLLAAGGIALERLSNRWKAITAGALVLGGVAFAPLSLPVLPIEATDRYITTVTFGKFENVYELTADLHGMYGWRERVQAVAEVYHALPDNERRHAILFAPGYGTAGAIDYFGAEHGLPRAFSSAQSYWLWGPPPASGEPIIALRWRRETLERFCGEVADAASVELEKVNPWETPFEIRICRKPLRPLAELWPQFRPW